MTIPSLIYIADPMCSWCWGFSPVLEEIIRQYHDQVSFELLLGGLRPGNTERFDKSRRAYILQHWKAVYERTGQPFNFDFEMGDTFTYDTEPASRAVVAIRHLAPQKVWNYLKDVQQAFYVENADVTNADVLEGLAIKLEVASSQFREMFQDSKTKQLVWEEFDQAREFGVDGFPTLLGRQDQSVSTLMHGYQDIKSLGLSINNFLEKVA